MRKRYHSKTPKTKKAEAQQAADSLTNFYRENGQQLLPLVELVEQARLAVGTLIDQVTVQTVELILRLSAEQVAGARTPGKASGEIRWHGRQDGSISLGDRKLAVERPRLRHKDRGEVRVPAYDALKTNTEMKARMLDQMLRGVSTREYQKVIPQMAQTVGVSKSAVSREAIQASAKQLEELMERRWEKTDLLIIYLDGMRFGAHHVISAVGVDRQGGKHVLGIEPGSSENSVAVKDLLTRLRDRGLSADRKYLFVIDGSAALRLAINEVFGAHQPVQRCRNHKMQNVTAHLPQAEQAQARSLMRAAYKLPAKEGMARMNKMAEWLERSWPKAAASLREGLEETFTINSLKVPPSLFACLATTNIIESPQGGVRARTLRVSRWQDQDMVLRWVASAFLVTEKSFRKIMGYRDLWALAAILGRSEDQQKSTSPSEKVA